MLRVAAELFPGARQTGLLSFGCFKARKAA
jgi:hypothetical protein